MFSVVEYYFYSEPRKYSCGYCKEKNAYKRFGMWAHTLTVQDYQNLIDRGWRRSGSYCYKPVNEEACCPMYTIKCEALNFMVSKSQKKIIKKVAKYLKDGKIEDDNKRKILDRTKNHNVTPNDIDICNVIEADYNEHAAQAQIDLFDNDDEMVIENECDKRLMHPPFVEDNNTALLNINTANEGDNSQIESTMQDNIVNKSVNENNLSITPPTIANDKKKNVNCRMSESDSGALPRKAKLIRIERAKNRLLAQGKTLEEIEIIYKKKKEQKRPKKIEDLLDNIIDGKNKLELKLVRVSSEDFMETLDESVELFKKYQIAVHNDEPYECDKQSFLNFLGKTPLQHFVAESGPPLGYGSFHQQYWLNNKLIAVGVIDILPYCVSSVYFFYDPAFSFLSLGTYSSLMEVRLTRELNKKVKDLKYYYMGYYIHSIPKMRYKAKMRPSKLLCPATFKWFDIDHCIPKLNENKYSRFNDNPDDFDEDGKINTSALMQVGIYYRGRRLYRDIQRKYRSDDIHEVREYAELVGKKCAYNMYLVRC
ncbi:hypothetical protein PV327_007575 [Microctonus hyperodae]|uniref:Arginyl-tRNA--protein transferase 1 n=1 Tax=Microctonus hyperodae TaxID=165561 RepID=A0AA39FZH0_MICHY|nr:hypothetical protein PV327_007575 [Microctonus hyperodae]